MAVGRTREIIYIYNFTCSFTLLTGVAQHGKQKFKQKSEMYNSHQSIKSKRKVKCAE